jgi:mannose-1-phosphate guanylyltransferase
MSDSDIKESKNWCIVIADDHGPEYVPSIAVMTNQSPVQFCGFGEPTTLLQKALHRARHIAPATQIAVTVREENRGRWESALWCVRPERRFVSDTRMMSSLTMAAALLSIAADSASNVVTILPARCYVANDWKLSSALDTLRKMLPRIPEGVGTLGMIDIDCAVDEDYLVPCAAEAGPGLAVLGMAHRPVGWVAHHLRQQGAMVASGILTGYAGVFAAHIYRRWPELAGALDKLTEAANRGENLLRANMYRDVPRWVLRSLKWWPPMFPQRALRVFRCGWRGLHTARAVTRVAASCPVTIDSVLQCPPQSEFQSERTLRAGLCDEFDHAAIRTDPPARSYYLGTGNRAEGTARRDIDHGCVD